MPGWEKGKLSLAERVSQAYYTHGVFIAAHPYPVIATAIALVLFSCIPLVKLPLPSNVPQLYSEKINSSGVHEEAPRWFSSTESPIYIQQVIMKSSVSPWEEGMLLTDAFRAPLAEAFRLVEAIQNYQHQPSGVTLGDICYHVELAGGGTVQLPLPQFNCLLVSPANLWLSDPTRFFSDTRLITTIFNFHSMQIGKVSLAELLFGVRLKDAGIKRYPLRNRQRVIQFAATIFLSRRDPQYLEGLEGYLRNLYPALLGNTSTSSSILHVYHPGDFDFHEFLPLFFTYLMLYFYMYFSVRKIELVRSKVGMALSAVFTVIASLLMSIGICLFFGLDPAGSSRGREVFPYLVVVVGLENVLVLTKSVLSTQAHLDAKIRVAQGLSKEGWSITKNLLAEVTILTAGLFTLVPAIQELCIFAMVGLLCDFFLQVCFFATVLSLDIRGIEAAAGAGRGALRPLPYSSPARHTGIPRSRSTPRLHPGPSSTPDTNRIPKRLRLVHFWASTRIVQRAFMLCMVFWIGGIVYSAGVIKNLVSLPEGEVSSMGARRGPGLGRSPAGSEGGAAVLRTDEPPHMYHNQAEVLSSVGGARALGGMKWCYLVAAYNRSGAGPCRVGVLPPLRVGMVIPPSRAASLRNPLDPPEPPVQWHSLAQALDPADFLGEDGGEGDDEGRGWETPFLPTTPLEVLLVTALCVISMVVIAYTALALYHCVCSRNYAEWRSAWGSSPPTHTSQVVLEAMPLILEGHTQSVEGLASDGLSLASSCLEGKVIVWDASTAERLATIDRPRYFGSERKSSLGSDDDQHHSEDEALSSQRNGLRERGLRRQSTDFPDLSPAMSFKFSETPTTCSRRHQHRDGFDYGPTIRQLYLEQMGGRWDDTEGSTESLDCAAHCPQIWSMDLTDNLLALGTSSGRIEFWHASSGTLKSMFDDGCGVGVTCIKSAGSLRLAVARLNGSLEVFSLEWSPHFPPHPPAHRRLGHSRAASAGRAEEVSLGDGGGTCELRCRRVSSARAHQQPVTVLQADTVRIVTGSHDHTLKVWNVGDPERWVYTLHGHWGPVTCLVLDCEEPHTGGSGSQEGTLCVWDLLSGAAVFSLAAHHGPIAALSFSASYVLSLGADERLCVWDRFQGHLLNTIQVPQMYCTSMAMLTHNLLIASRQGSLVIWDVRNGEPVRLVKLGHCDGCVFVRTILPLRDSIACDYGNELRIVKFPLVRDKSD